MSYREKNPQLGQLTEGLDYIRSVDVEKLEVECTNLTLKEVAEMQDAVRQSIAELTKLDLSLQKKLVEHTASSSLVIDTSDALSDLKNLAYLTPYINQSPILSDVRSLWIASRSLSSQIYHHLPFTKIPEQLVENPLEMWIQIWENRYRKIYGENFTIDRKKLTCSTDLSLLVQAFQLDIVKGVFIEAYPTRIPSELIESSEVEKWLKNVFSGNDIVIANRWYQRPLVKMKVKDYIESSPRLHFILARRMVQSLGHGETFEFGNLPTFAQALIYKSLVRKCFPQVIGMDGNERNSVGQLLQGKAHEDGSVSFKRSFNDDENQQAFRLI